MGLKVGLMNIDGFSREMVNGRQRTVCWEGGGSYGCCISLSLSEQAS